VSLDVYNNGLKAALRAQAINDAKQVALAFIMCASDANDKLPMNSQDWKNMIGPYLKNDAAMSNFNYVFSGGSVTDIASPAETILGYITGPDGGRAVAYTDGHVRYLNH
jgi:prepilin-type processing-associated H-X9-DG protein